MSEHAGRNEHAGRSGESARARLRASAALLPERVREALRAPEPELDVDPARLSRILVTGVGSSAGNARFLASVLAEELGLPARYAATGALAGDPGGSDACLIVFSQGLSPNGCVALDRPARWGRVVLVTAIDASSGAPERRRRLAAAQSAGVRVAPLPTALADESGTLVRLVGPVVAYFAALALARAFARALGRSAAALSASEGEVIAALTSAGERAERAVAGRVASPFAGDAPLVFLASGGHAERVTNLVTKVQEALLLPAPGCWDVLEFAHGPFQQLHDGAAQIVFLARPDAAGQADLLERLRRMLPDAHTLHVLAAQLGGALAAVDHEAQCNALVLDAMQARAIDPEQWPGRGADAPLYEIGPAQEPERVPPRATLADRALERATSPEVAAALADGATTALVALGSTEQHGAHLPLATDTWLADALAARFCARVPEAWRCPTLALGCAVEHLSFPGTLSLAPATLEAILGDVLNSLSIHGFRDVFVFSAHGGNAAPLREMAERLAGLHPGLDVAIFSDHAAVADACHAAAAAHGVSPQAAGHHAGEFETSIVAALAAGAVRPGAVAGLLDTPADVQQVFYPDLRTSAPNGVVGDPRGADPRRAEAYLEAWVDLLVARYRAAKKRHQTKGTVNA